MPRQNLSNAKSMPDVTTATIRLQATTSRARRLACDSQLRVKAEESIDECVELRGTDMNNKGNECQRERYIEENATWKANST